MKNIILAITVLFFSHSFSQIHLKTDTKAKKINITDWILNTPKDKKIDSKYIVLNFWGTIKNDRHDYDFISQFNDFEEKFNREDLYFITMTSEEPEVIKNYFKDKKFKSIVVSDRKKITHRHYGNKDGSIVLPLTILIDKNGVIKWIGFPYYLTDMIIQDFINDKLVSYNMFEKPKK